MIILAVCLISYVVILKCANWKLSKNVGRLMILVYLLSITWVLINYYVEPFGASLRCVVES